MARNRVKPIDLKIEQELKNLHEYRLERFRNIFGEKLPEDAIEELVKSDIHPSEVEKLIESGCPQEIAYRIVKP